MNAPFEDDELLSRLGLWLREARAQAEQAGVGPPDEAEGPEVGLFRLVEEFTALRHEVKLQTKGTRGLQERAEELLAGLQAAIDQFRSVGPKEEQAALAAGRPLAEALADLDESLERGRVEIEKARARLDDRASAIEAGLDGLYAGQGWFRRRRLRSYHEQARAIVVRLARDGLPTPLDALLEGYGLIQSRLRRAMDSEGVRRIDVPGRPVDPGLMTVVEVVDAPDHRPGHVVDELRRGYTWRGRVLRYAEVSAAGKSAPAPEPVLDRDPTPSEWDEHGNDHRD